MNREFRIYRNYSAYAIMMCLSWMLFWIAFLATRTSIAPLAGTLSITFGAFVLYVLPILMFFSIRTFSVNQNVPVSTQLLHQLVQSVLMGFVYQLLSGYAIQFFGQFGLTQIIVIWVMVPLVVLLVRKRNTVRNINALIQITVKSRWIHLSVIIALLSLLIRFPFFISGEIGSDTFLHHILTESLISNGRLEWAINPLSLIQYWPASAAGSAIIQAGGLTLLTGIPVHEAIFVYSVCNGMISTLLFLLLLFAACRARILPKDAIPLTAALYAFLPLLLKFSDWTLVGRGTFLVVAPAALFIVLDDVFCTPQRKLGTRAATWILVSISLFITHGLGRILVVGLVVLVSTNWCIPRIRSLLSRHRLHAYHPTGKARFAVPALALGLFLLPYILYSFGDLNLIGWYVLDRTDMTNSLDTSPLGLLLGFLFIFGARFGIAAPLFLFGVFTLPKLITSDMQNITPYVLSVVLFFPFLLHSMYYYQALSVQIVIIAGLTAYCAICKISSRLGSITIRGLGFPNSHVMKRVMTVSVLLICISSSMFIQSTRASSGMVISNDSLLVSRYIEEHVANENISVFASSASVSLRVGAFVPSIPIFPMKMTLFFSHFPDQWSNIVYTTISLTPSFENYLRLLRNGFVTGEIEDLVNANKFSFSCSEEEFNMIQERLNLKYLIHRDIEDWPLLQMLIEQRWIQLLQSYGEFHLYIVL